MGQRAARRKGPDQGCETGTRTDGDGVLDLLEPAEVAPQQVLDAVVVDNLPQHLDLLLLELGARLGLDVLGEDVLKHPAGRVDALDAEAPGERDGDARRRRRRRPRLVRLLRVGADGQAVRRRQERVEDRRLADRGQAGERHGKLVAGRLLGLGRGERRQVREQGVLADNLGRRKARRGRGNGRRRRRRHVGRRHERLEKDGREARAEV